MVNQRTEHTRPLVLASIVYNARRWPGVNPGSFLILSPCQSAAVGCRVEKAIDFEIGRQIA